MRTLKLLVALIAVASAAACGSPDDDRSTVDTLVPPPTGEVQDPPPPGASTSTSDVASSGPVLSTTTTTVPSGSLSTVNPDTGNSTASAGATGTTRAGSTTETTGATGATGAPGTSGTTGTTGAAQTSTTTRVSATTRPSGPPATTSPTTATTPPKQAQTISFAQPPGPWAYGEPKSVVATASSGLPVSYDTTGACVVENALLGVVRASDVGACRITVSQQGDSSWKPADPVTRSITVSKAAPVITGFVGRSTEYPRHAFSIPLTAATNDGAIVKYRTLPDEYNDFLCTIAGAELKVPSTLGLPRTCIVEAYVEESRLFAAASKVERFEITPTVVEFTGSSILAVSDASVTVSVTLNRAWGITADADCSTTYPSGYGNASYELTFAVTPPAPGETPCTITTISISIVQVDGAHTSQNETLTINVPSP